MIETRLAGLARTLLRARLIIVTPALIGVGLFVALGGVTEGPDMPSLLSLSLGLAGASIAAWILRIGVDAKYLPDLARDRGLDYEMLASHPYRLVPDGVLPEGNTRMMRNVFSGRIADRRWQAGFLEVTRKQRNGNRAMTIFRGQMLQIEAAAGQADFILLPAFRLPTVASGSFGTGALTERANLTILGRKWQLSAAGDVAPDLPGRLQQVLDGLPPAPRGAKLRAVLRVNGWYHLVYANRSDLLRLGDFAMYWRSASSAARRVFNHLDWAERVVQTVRQVDGTGS